MIFLIDFVSWILATDSIITAWFYGTIFVKFRESIEDRGGLLGELAGCPLCLSYHVSFLLVGLLLWLPVQLLSELPLHWCLLAHAPRLILYAFAVTDVVHWLQGERPIPLEKEDE